MEPTRDRDRIDRADRRHRVPNPEPAVLPAFRRGEGLGRAPRIIGISRRPRAIAYIVIYRTQRCERGGAGGAVAWSGECRIRGLASDLRTCRWGGGRGRKPRTRKTGRRAGGRAG